MLPITLSNISRIVNAKLINNINNDVIFTISLDSRKITKHKKCLFIALKGKVFDSHNFVLEAINNGVIAILVHYEYKINIPQLIVYDTKKALGKLSAWIRQQYKVKVLAITGTSGKTSVKEITTSILKQCGNVLCNFGNQNNDIGVPITLLKLTAKHNFAVIELGSNKFGDIIWINSLVKPEIVLINNISFAHLKGFKNIYGVSRAKSEIFLEKSVCHCIINLNSNDIKNWKPLLYNKKVWYFSLYKNNLSHFFIVNIINNKNSISYCLYTPIGNCKITIPLFGIYNISNIIAASALAILAGAPLSAVVNGISQLSPISGRLYPIILSKNKLLIDDSYNANVSSTILAANILSKFYSHKIMIVSDILELGNKSILYHEFIGKIINNFDIDEILTIGKLSYFIGKNINHSKHFFNLVHLVKYIKKLILYCSSITILVKGSHNTLASNIVNMLINNILC
ncbi:MAG: UDP-N-acetylmuramoyl-tripeptide--D-alanyl-D-alanine ligase [Candidatus Lightella neohaematopini]|nr:UDP-N-acetylmuramoyl-tripeptide--D-alanyl-D-alanine ligase [Candidatus Lightella neohaematopini]MCV2528746.1 UDP-N-acetylmuramoyl-tripeptide--D-alanyl-D-alanine ligase [Candidatus Lightella neohaematopini]